MHFISIYCFMKLVSYEIRKLYYNNILFLIKLKYAALHSLGILAYSTQICFLDFGPWDAMIYNIYPNQVVNLTRGPPELISRPPLVV